MESCFYVYATNKKKNIFQIELSDTNDTLDKGTSNTFFLNKRSVNLTTIT